MGKHVHKLKEKNLDEMTGSCANCGPVTLVATSNGSQKCSNSKWKYNKETRSAQNKRAYNKNPEHRRVKALANHFNNRERQLEAMKRWREMNPGYAKEWAYDNPEKIAKHHEIRAAHLLRMPNTMPKNWWTKLLDFYEHKCCACGSTEDLTHDHVIPVSWFCSTHSLENSQVLCRPCNSGKKNYSRQDFRDGKIMSLNSEHEFIQQNG